MGEKMMDEERLWFELDKIKDSPKGQAAVVMMGFLRKPSPEQCRKMYIEDGD